MKTDNIETVAQRAAAEIRDLARRRDVSYTQLLGEMDIQYSTMYAWERGGQDIKGSSLEKIWRAGGNLYAIITGEEPERTYTIDEVRNAMYKAVRDVENGLPADMIHVSDYLPIG